jgi:hypothetical protein
VADVDVMLPVLSALVKVVVMLCLLQVEDVGRA